MSMRDIRGILDPKTIALVGATDKPDSFGRLILENLLASADKRVFPVNPFKAGILDVPAFPNISSLPEPVDLAVVVTPAPTVPSVLEECGKAGVKGVIIISSGFKEAGVNGGQLVDEIDNVRTRYSLRVVGPDCLGLVRPGIGFNATPLAVSPAPGDIAFVSQSGAFGRALVEWGIDMHLGFSMFASLGNMLDVDFGDMIDFLSHDPGTRSVMIYTEEGIGDVRKFIAAARECSRNKPIVLLKPAQTGEEDQLARSHSGYLATNDRIFDAVCKRAGVVRVRTAADLFNAARVLYSLNLPKGPKLLIMTNAAGPGAMAVNALIELGGKVARLSREGAENVKSLFPPFWEQGTFINLQRDAGVSRYRDVLKVCLADDGVDGILVVLTPQGVVEPTELATAIVDLTRRTSKPVIAVWMSGTEGRETLLRGNIPVYNTPEDAVRTYVYMHEYTRNLAILDESPSDVPADSTPQKKTLKALIRRSLDQGQAVLSDEESKKFLTHYGIRANRSRGAADLEEAVKVADSEGYPLALKVVSPEIGHKSDAGGVVLGISSEEELRQEYEKMMGRVKAYCPECTVAGVTVEKMVEKIDYEVILGAKKDKDFGSVILFGMGGVGVQIFQDFSIALPPLNRTLVRNLMEGTRVYRLLQGYRGRPPANLGKLEEVILSFSQLIADFPEIGEIDINPLALSGNRAVALDARIILDTDYASASPPPPHLIVIPYPARHVFHWVLRDGTEVLIRPMGPEDEDATGEMRTSLSEKPLGESFFHVIDRSAREAPAKLSNVDYESEVAIVAEIREGYNRRIVGMGRLTIDPDFTRAEFDIFVLDAFQDKGLGSRLVDAVVDLGREKGIREIYGVILSDNTKMLKMCAKRGCTFETLEKGTTRVTLTFP